MQGICACLRCAKKNENNIYTFLYMKQILRLLSCLLFFVGFAGKATAATAEEARYLVLTLADGTFREFQLSEKPVMAFDSNKLTVSTDATSAEFSSKEVKLFRFLAEPTAIERVEAGRGVVVRHTDNTTVSLAGVSNAAVSLYDAAGNLVSRQLPADGRVDVSLQTLTPGVYVLQYEKNSSIKIIKK